MVQLPDIPLADDPDYAVLLGHQFDTWQETYDMHFHIGLERKLDTAKADAAEAAKHRGAPVIIDIRGEKFEVAGHGASGGVRYVLRADDFMILLRSDKQSWNVTVRYLSAGLWQYGYPALQRRWRQMSRGIGGYRSVDPEHGHVTHVARVGRLDYCFDFHSPAFSAEMRDNAIIERFVIPKQSKVQRHHQLSSYGKATGFETITVGKLPGCQVQVYDKGREISQVSGKTWMREAWAKLSGFIVSDPIEDVWRIECRFGKEWLKDRDIRSPDQVQKNLADMLCGALMQRRLTSAPEASNDNQVWRHSLHPLWSMAYRAAGETGQTPGVGRQTTQRAAALLEQNEKALRGLLRNHSILATGAWDADWLREEVERLIAHMDRDSREREKIDAALDRYSTVNRAR